MRLRESGEEDERTRNEKQQAPPEARAPVKIALPRQLLAKMLQCATCIARIGPKLVRADLPGQVAEADDRENGTDRFQLVPVNEHPEGESDGHRGKYKIEVDCAPSHLAVHGFNPVADLLVAHAKSLVVLRPPKRGDIVTFHGVLHG